MKPEEILKDVVDRESFISFARALAAEAERVEEMIRADPEKWKWDGAEGWQNTSVSSFLWAAVSYFEWPSEPNKDAPTWQDVAEFLMNGKVLE